ncbi:MAG: hypothetical protein WA602_17725 [Silvibacterium sp.]
MSDDTALMLLWALIFAAVGLMVGVKLGDEARRRRCAEDKVDQLRDQLEHASAPIQERQLKEMRSVLNDAHKHILAVSKGLQKQPR